MVGNGVTRPRWRCPRPQACGASCQATSRSSPSGGSGSTATPPTSSPVSTSSTAHLPCGDSRSCPIHDSRRSAHGVGVRHPVHGGAQPPGDVVARRRPPAPARRRRPTRAAAEAACVVMTSPSTVTTWSSLVMPVPTTLSATAFRDIATNPAAWRLDRFFISVPQDYFCHYPYAGGPLSAICDSAVLLPRRRRSDDPRRAAREGRGRRPTDGRRHRDPLLGLQRVRACRHGQRGLLVGEPPDVLADVLGPQLHQLRRLPDGPRGHAELAPVDRQRQRHQLGRRDEAHHRRPARRSARSPGGVPTTGPPAPPATWRTSSAWSTPTRSSCPRTAGAASSPGSASPAAAASGRAASCTSATPHCAAPASRR